MPARRHGLATLTLFAVRYLFPGRHDTGLPRLDDEISKRGGKLRLINFTVLVLIPRVSAEYLAVQ